MAQRNGYMMKEIGLDTVHFFRREIPLRRYSRHWLDHISTPITAADLEVSSDRMQLLGSFRVSARTYDYNASSSYRRRPLDTYRHISNDPIGLTLFSAEQMSYIESKAYVIRYTT